MMSRDFQQSSAATENRLKVPSRDDIGGLLVASEPRVRAILFDTDGKLVLIRRKKPRQKTYYVFPGGGVEPSDKSFEHALMRELIEELGATARVGREVYTRSWTVPKVREPAEHFFLCKLQSLDVAKRSGREFLMPERGEYKCITVSPQHRTFQAFNLQPHLIHEFIMTNLNQLMMEAIIL